MQLFSPNGINEDFRADLHCHSTFSDGLKSPHELIDLALAIGLRGLSITDHDTTRAYPDALEYAKKKGLLLLNGIEFSAHYQAEPVHVLGYGFCTKSEEIAGLCARHQKRREERNQAILDKLRRLGISILPEELEGVQGTIGRPHIAHLLVVKGIVGSVKEAFARYLAEDKLAYVAGRSVSVEETIEVIHQAQGIAVLAHPHLIKRSTTIRGVLKMPFDGLECYYAHFSIEQVKKWIDLARQKGWFVSGGSDYHGDLKPYNALGSSWVDKERFELLYDRFLAVNFPQKA